MFLCVKSKVMQKMVSTSYYNQARAKKAREREKNSNFSQFTGGKFPFCFGKYPDCPEEAKKFAERFEKGKKNQFKKEDVPRGCATCPFFKW